MLDEPLNGADPVQRVALIDLFHALGDQGRTVIVSSHVLHEVERLAARQVVIDPRAAGRRRRPPRDPRRAGRPARGRSWSAPPPPGELAAGLMSRRRRAGRDASTAPRSPSPPSGPASWPPLLPRVARDAGARLREVRPLDDSLESVFRELLR